MLSAVAIGDTAPANPVPGNLWWDSVGGLLYIYFNDGTSTQWVDVNNLQGGLGDAPTDGFLYGRQNAAWQRAPAATPGRNRLINGHFIVDQRNNFAAVTPGVGNVYTADRWSLNASQGSKVSGITYGAGTVIFPPGCAGQFTASTASAFTAAPADFFILQQPIEFQNMTDFNFGTASAQSLTLSFWANASIAGTYSGALSNNASNRSYVFAFTLPANVWTKISISIPGDTAGTWYPGSASVLGMTVRFDLGSGSNSHTSTIGVWQAVGYIGATGSVAMVANAGANLSFANVQLELGPVATPFDWRSVGDTLEACQRYYQAATILHVGYATAGLTQIVNYPFPTQMRATPTLTPTTNANSNVSAVSLSGLNNGAAVYMTATVTVAGGFNFNQNFTASAEL